MPIGPVTMFAIYVVVWWVVLFAILPLGTSREFLTTPWVALIVWAGVMLLVWIGWMPLPDLAPPSV